MIESAQVIQVYGTGGTIAKEYATRAGTRDLEIGPPAATRILHRQRVSLEFKITELLRKDSLDMTDNDREVIVRACQTCLSDRILIEHGTDTIKKTAESLDATKLPKTIVLYGGSIPEVFRDSDAEFHFGAAVIAVQTLPQGVYIAMHGLVDHWMRLVKDQETGLFYRE